LYTILDFCQDIFVAASFPFYSFPELEIIFLKAEYGIENFRPYAFTEKCSKSWWGALFRVTVDPKLSNAK
jgi:hypothetical protein